MRKTFFKLLEDLPANYYFLTGDVGYPFNESLARHLGSRFINMGIAEKNMVSFACGLAQKEKVFCYSIGPFLTTYALASIRNDLFYHHSNVVLVSCGRGLDYGGQGFTHHSYEDLNLISFYPTIKIYSPSTESDLVNSLNEIMKLDGPSYLRLSRLGLSQYKKESTLIYRITDGTKATVLCSYVEDSLIKFCVENQLELINVVKINEETIDLILSLISNKYIILLEECLFSGPLFKLLFPLLSDSKIIKSVNLDIDLDYIGSKKIMQEKQSYPFGKMKKCLENHGP